MTSVMKSAELPLSLKGKKGGRKERTRRRKREEGNKEGKEEEEKRKKEKEGEKEEKRGRRERRKVIFLNISAPKHTHSIGKAFVGAVNLPKGSFMALVVV